MSYAIVQRELTTPDAASLTRAFTVLPEFTALDAQTAFRDAFGILWRGLNLEDASVLQDALQREKVDTLVVEESDLPVIPPAKTVRQIEFLPSHLNLFDPLNRAFALPWTDLMLIASGHVSLREVRRVRNTLEDATFHGAGISGDTIAGSRAKEENTFHLMLELIITGGVGRYSIKADEFVFDHLGGRQTNDPAMNFVLFIQDLAERAPMAGLNRGASMACRQPPELCGYPSKSAFHEELTWMLWRTAQLRRDAGR